MSIPPIRPDGLQIDEKRRLQSRLWSLQRLGWLVFGVVVALALLGLTGSGGPLQKQVIEFTQAQVEMPRVSRWEGADAVKLTFHTASDTPEFTLNQAFMDHFKIERIQPEPVSSTLVTDGERFRFEAAGDAPHAVKVEMRAMHFGWIRFVLAIGDERKNAGILVLP
ncbi:hypothetical protein [Salipiger sp. PrR007]|nr:hypothetical protein [Salipiger sp. PrR007]NDW32747.1 hypothetical protein [Salipiger sp. PrR007]